MQQPNVNLFEFIFFSFLLSYPPFTVLNHKFHKRAFGLFAFKGLIRPVSLSLERIIFHIVVWRGSFRYNIDFHTWLSFSLSRFPLITVSICRIGFSVVVLLRNSSRFMRQLLSFFGPMLAVFLCVHSIVRWTRFIFVLLLYGVRCLFIEYTCATWNGVTFKMEKMRLKKLIRWDFWTHANEIKKNLFLELLINSLRAFWEQCFLESEIQEIG